MTSALISLVNASATLNLPTAGTFVDPVTGNVRANTESVTVEIWLREATMEPTDLPGINVEGDVLEGYAMDALDARIQPGTVGTLLYSGNTHRCEILAARQPFGTTGTLGLILQSVLGDRVRLIRYRQAA